MSLYVNGQLASGALAVWGTLENFHKLWIGRDELSNTYFDGKIDEVRIYGSALSGDQIKADMQTPVNPTVAAYSFNEGEGSVAHDSARSHDGTISGATWTPNGKFGSALDFNGTNALVSVADANDLDLTNSFTLEAWVRPDTLSSWSSAISKASWPGGFSGYTLAADYKGYPTGIVMASGATGGVAAPSALSTGTWTHLAFTSDGKYLRLYVNGKLAETQPAISAASTEVALNIGYSQIGKKYFDGLIDEVRIYEVPLSQSQIETDESTPIDPKPIAAYSFNEGTGSTLGDSTGNHNGTINGPTWTTGGKYGSALDFDGTNDLVTVADASDLDLTGSFTMEAWIRPYALKQWYSVLSKASWTGGLSGYTLAAKYNELPTGVTASVGTTGGVAGTESLPIETWSYLAWTSDGNTQRLYVNGQLVGSASATPIAATTAQLDIGYTQIGLKYFDGKIDEMRLYSLPLSQAQIESDMNSPI